MLALLGDSVTTDHISPAGAIHPDSPAGRWLVDQGVGAGGLQLLRGAPRQPRGDDPGHVRQPAHPQPAGAGHRGRRHHPPAVGRADVDLRGRRALPRRGRAAGRAGRQGVRLGLVARLGGQGHGAAGRAGGGGRELRAHPPVEPDRHGRAAAAAPRRRHVRRPRASTATERRGEFTSGMAGADPATLHRRAPASRCRRSATPTWRSPSASTRPPRRPTTSTAASSRTSSASTCPRRDA